jgi:lactoylglutathione lyase
MAGFQSRGGGRGQRAIMQSPDDKPVERVTGIGGIFFKAQDPARMTEWYAKNLGIESTEFGAEFHWRDAERPEEKGQTVWSLFPADTDYFGPSAQTFMVNYRVANLDRMLEQLRRNGISEIKVEDSGYGRFAWFTDPEGNRIELWEPIEEGASPGTSG